MSRPLSIGIGCRHACPGATIAALVARACAGLDRVGAGLFSVAAKQDEAGLHAASEALGLPLVFLSAEALRDALPAVTIRSARVEAAVGVPSVAEAAALAGAGIGARLIVPRMMEGGATCAVAIAEPQL